MINEVLDQCSTAVSGTKTEEKNSTEEGTKEEEEEEEDES